MDPSTFFALVLGAGIGLLLTPTPTRQAPRLLHAVGKRPGLQFAFDRHGRLSSGPQVEQLLTRLLWRQTRATGAFLAAFALAELIVINGPRLSRSTTSSFLTAALLVVGLVAPYLLQRPFLEPCAPSAGALRPAVRAEDYVDPVRRVLVWAGAATVVLIPLGALTLAATSTYVGARFYWEGLVGLPVATVAVVVAVERKLQGLRDSAADPGLGFFWDLVRQRAVHQLMSLALLGTTLCWYLAAAAVSGVALAGPGRPDWSVTLAAGCRGAAFFFALSTMSFLFVRRVRFRATLWPGLAPGDKVPWAGVRVSSPA